jgi:hypothetical protein
VSYERVHGRISSNDAWFAWLRPLSQAIAKLDELSESDDAASRDTIPALLASVRMLLMPTEEGEGFGRQYYAALQRSLDVVLAHAAVRTLLEQSISTKGWPR